MIELHYTKFKEIDGKMTGHFFGKGDYLQEIIDALPQYEFGVDWKRRGNEREIKIIRLDDKEWTKAEIALIDKLIAEHGTQEAHEKREALKECYENRVYPPVGDQLDALWKDIKPTHEEAIKMKARIEKIKTDNPKPRI